MNVNFCTISEYVQSASDLVGRIAKINSLIDAMELVLIDSTGSANYSEYQMDDGQMKVRASYRNPSEVTAGINELEKLKQRYINRLNGRRTVLRSGQF